ncbi:MAG: hypothetical protein ABR611_04900 [Chthoniobacterales bacterium]
MKLDRRHYYAALGLCAVIGVVIGLFVTPPSADDHEREYLAAEGRAITAEMEAANRNHDFARVAEIRQRDAEFKRRADAYLRAHGRTPPPR